MKRAFNIVCCVDVALLLLPTRYLEAHVEFWLAATFTVVTGGLWAVLLVAERLGVR